MHKSLVSRVESNKDLVNQYVEFRNRDTLKEGRELPKSEGVYQYMLLQFATETKKSMPVSVLSELIRSNSEIVRSMLGVY
ncbi:MAG: hypothetical protein ACE5J2_03545 [Nitrososphaerales archaeon]